jgi:hypothetical protein
MPTVSSVDGSTLKAYIPIQVLCCMEATQSDLRTSCGRENVSLRVLVYQYQLWLSFAIWRLLPLFLSLEIALEEGKLPSAWNIQGGGVTV